MIAFGEVRAHLPPGTLKGANNGRVAGGGALHLRRNQGLTVKRLSASAFEERALGVIPC